MQFAGIIIAFAALIGLFANAGRKIFLWLGPVFAGISPVIYGILYGIVITGVLGIFVVSRAPGNGVPRVIIWAGHYGLGFIIYMMLLVNFVDLLIFLGRFFHVLPVLLSRKSACAIGTVTLLAAAGLSVYGAYHGSVIQTHHYTVSIPEKSAGGRPLRIALISDLHLGYVIEEKHVEKIVTAVNALNPDIICIAGDIFDGDATALSDSVKLQNLLREMEAGYGVYACLGNHDAGKTYDKMLDFLSGAGIYVLQDEAVIIDNRVVLAGRKDSSPIGGQGAGRMAFQWPGESKNLPVIVLDHQPSNISEYGKDADVILCGHTHRGQMFPFNLVTNAAFDVDYGYYRASEDSPQVIVTSGAGTWGPPQRVGTDNEVADILIE